VPPIQDADVLWFKFETRGFFVIAQRVFNRAD
jgi:hypothetical protein